MRIKGDYMKPHTSFYDAKAMDPPYTKVEIEKFEKNIYKEVEVAIR